MTPPSEEDAARFELRRPRRPWGAVALMVLLATSFTLSTLEASGPAGWPQALMVLAVTAAISLFVLGFGRRAPSEIIEVSPRAVRLPFGAASVEVPLDQIAGLALEEGDRPGLFVSTERFVVFFPRQRFESAEAVRAAHEAIKSRIAQLPGGAQKAAILDAARFDEAGPARRPWGTEGVVVLFVVVLGVLLATRSLSVEQPLEVLRLGVNAQVLVAAGDWWRVPTSVLLHLGLVHLILVAMSLFGLGVAAERLLGTPGFLVVFLGSALAGALGSAAFPEGMPYTAGASGGVFGLLGALLYVYWRFRGRIPLRFQIPERTWFGILAINFLLLIQVGTVDGPMLLGGLISGVLLAMLVAGDAQAVPLAKAGPLSLALVGVLGFVYAAGVVGTLRAYDVDVRPRQLAVVRALAGVEYVDPSFLNVVAWSYAIAADPSEAELMAAEKLAERAVDVRDVWAYRDTWATLAFRRGDTERAIGLQLEALVDEAVARKRDPELPAQDRVLVSQLARFLDAHARQRGPLHPAGAVPTMRAVEHQGRVRLEVAGPVERPLSVWVLARDGDTLAGLGRYPLLPASGSQTVDTQETLAWSRTASLSVALVASGTVAARAWTLDPSVLAYPGIATSP